MQCKNCQGLSVTQSGEIIFCQTCNSHFKEDQDGNWVVTEPPVEPPQVKPEPEPIAKPEPQPEPGTQPETQPDEQRKIDAGICTFTFEDE